MYAFGARPETRTFVPSVFVASLSWSPAAIPEACVAWAELMVPHGIRPVLYVFAAGANARATIAFGVVYAVLPFGKPAGYEKPVGVKKSCVWSRPSSITPILIPWPEVASVGPQ